MADEIEALLDAAIRKEIEAQSNYLAANDRITNPSVQGLLRALADEEGQHIQKVSELKGLNSDEWIQEKVHELINSEWINSEGILPDSDIGEILKYAIYREQLSIEFYQKLMDIVKSISAKALCEELGNEELHHKSKVELMYNDLYLR